jgi:hypothetical protein
VINNLPRCHRVATWASESVRLSGRSQGSHVTDPEKCQQNLIINCVAVAVNVFNITEAGGGSTLVIGVGGRGRRGRKRERVPGSRGRVAVAAVGILAVVRGMAQLQGLTLVQYSAPHKHFIHQTHF